MKKVYLLLAAGMFLMMASCGPKRYGCYGKRRCITQSTQKTNTIEKGCQMAAFFIIT
jgi:hypothetical protein